MPHTGLGMHDPVVRGVCVCVLGGRGGEEGGGVGERQLLTMLLVSNGFVIVIITPQEAK